MQKKVRDEELLLLMLSGKSQTAIAEELGCTKQTICARLKTPEFAELLSEYRKKLLDSVITDLSANCQKAVKVLVQLLDDPSPKIRFNTASKILSLAQDYSIQQDILKDLEAIKAFQREQEA